MMADLDRQSLRGFLAQLEKELPEELLRITEPVRTHLDSTSLVYELERLGQSPAVVFDNIEGHSMPVITNIAGNRKCSLWRWSRRAICRWRFRERCAAIRLSSW
jgi:4-hydroxy-3-polyprenylbenzoate decarboxylase